jgi:hypothetical protein
VVKEGLVDAVSRARDCHEPRLLLWGAIAAEVAGEEEVEAPRRALWVLETADACRD